MFGLHGYHQVSLSELPIVQTEKVAHDSVDLQLIYCLGLKLPISVLLR